MIIRDLIKDINVLQSIINRDRFTYVLFQYDEEEMLRIESSIKRLKKVLINYKDSIIDEDDLNDIIYEIEFDDISDIVNALDRENEMIFLSRL